MSDNCLSRQSSTQPRTAICVDRVLGAPVDLIHTDARQFVAAQAISLRSSPPPAKTSDSLEQQYTHISDGHAHSKESKAFLAIASTSERLMVRRLGCMRAHVSVAFVLCTRRFTVCCWLRMPVTALVAGAFASAVRALPVSCLQYYLAGSHSVCRSVIPPRPTPSDVA